MASLPNQQQQQHKVKVDNSMTACSSSNVTSPRAGTVAPSYLGHGVLDIGRDLDLDLGVQQQPSLDADVISKRSNDVIVQSFIDAMQLGSRDVRDLLAATRLADDDVTMCNNKSNKKASPSPGQPAEAEMVVNCSRKPKRSRKRKSDKQQVAMVTMSSTIYSLSNTGNNNTSSHSDENLTTDAGSIWLDYLTQAPVNQTPSSQSSKSTTPTTKPRPKVSRARARRTHVCAECGLGFPTEKYLHMHESLHVMPPINQDVKDESHSVIGANSGLHVTGGDISGAVTSANKSTLVGGCENNTEEFVTKFEPMQVSNTSDDVTAGVVLSSAVEGDATKDNTQQQQQEHKSWTCNICWKVFDQVAAFKSHQTQHSTERPYVCDICHIGFKERYHLKKHELFKHTSELKEKCRVCGKQFKDTTAVRAHERIHSDQRPYACRHCGKAFKTSECLWHHENRSKVCSVLCGHSQTPKPRPPKVRHVNHAATSGDVSKRALISSSKAHKKTSVSNLQNTSSEQPIGAQVSQPRDMAQPIELQQTTQETVTVKMEHAASISQQQSELDLSLLYKCLGPNFNPNLLTLDSSLHVNSALVCSGSTTEPTPNSISAFSTNENSNLTEVKELKCDWLKGNDVLTAHLNPSQSESQLTVTQQTSTSLPAFSLTGGQQSRVAVIRPITANQKLAGDQLTTTTPATAATVKDIVTSPYKGKVKVKPNNKVIKIVTCDACDMLFSSKAAYKRHRIVHRTSEPHQCPHCDATFKLKVHLKKHITYRHCDERPFPCTRCPKSFKDTSARRLHERVHDLPRPYVCQCGRTFKTNELLTSHRSEMTCIALTSSATTAVAQGSDVMIGVSSSRDWSHQHHKQQFGCGYNDSLPPFNTLAASLNTLQHDNVFTDNSESSHSSNSSSGGPNPTPDTSLVVEHNGVTTAEQQHQQLLAQYSSENSKKLSPKLPGIHSLLRVANPMTAAAATTNNSFFNQQSQGQPYNNLDLGLSATTAATTASTGNEAIGLTLMTAPDGLVSYYGIHNGAYFGLGLPPFIWLQGQGQAVQGHEQLSAVSWHGVGQS